MSCLPLPFVIGIGLEDSKCILNYFYLCLSTGNFFPTGFLGYIQPHLLPVTENFTFDPNFGLLFLLSPPLRMLRPLGFFGTKLTRK